MNIFNLLNRFWESDMAEPMPPSAIAPYHFLLYEANRLYWKMPIRCSTTLLCYRLKLSRQGLCDARRLLAERGFIEYTNGNAGKQLSTYTIKAPSAADLTDNLTGRLTPDLTTELTQDLTNGLTTDLTIIKTKDKDIKINSSSLSAREEKEVLVSLDEVRTVLLSDEEWKSRLAKTINHPDVKSALDINQWLTRFIDELKAKGVTAKTGSDARSHFYNWLRRRLSDRNTTQNVKSKSASSREFDTNCYRSTPTDNPKSVF